MQDHAAETHRLTSSGVALTVELFGETLTFRYSGRLTPSAGQPLSDAEYAIACELADRIGALKNSAGDEAVIARSANAWERAPNTIWHPLFAKNRRDIAHLRLFCQSFTGFDPITNRIDGMVPMEIPPDIDARLRGHTDFFAEFMVPLLFDHLRLPAYARVRLPFRFGETGPLCDGFAANYDTWSLQAEVNGLYANGLLRRLRERAAGGRRVTVVEIGSGFGGLALPLRQAVGETLGFVAIDLPDSLLFAAIYLSVLWRDKPIYLATPEGYLAVGTWRTTRTLPQGFAAVFVVPALAERVLRELRPVDLLVNFRSMQEMSDAQVAEYGRLAQMAMGARGLFYEQNAMTRDCDRDVKGILAGLFAFGGPVPESDLRGLSPGSLWSNVPLDLAPPDDRLR